ncbi:unnamed protein product [Alopecurus aequalis]
MNAPPPRHQTNASARRGWSNLPRDLVTDVHGRLNFLDRLACTAVFGEAFKQEAPWLLLHGQQFKADTATVFSLVDPRVAIVRIPDPALHDRVIMGSSGGWLVTTDSGARMYMINPVTGEQAALPAIATMPFIDDADPWITLDIKPFRDTLYSGKPYDHDLKSFNNNVLQASSDETGLRYFTHDEIRFDFYSKDAIHHEGRFYSITFSGVVEVWEEHDGEFTSRVVTPSRSRLAKEDDYWRGRKYLAAALDGRLMVLIKKEKKKEDSWTWKCFFTVQVLDDATRRWEDTHDIGEAAVFVGVNSSLCVSTREHPELIAGCVYFTYDQMTTRTRHEKSLSRRYWSNDRCSQWDVGVYSLKYHKVKEIKALGWHRNWPPPAWFTPSFS